MKKSGFLYQTATFFMKVTLIYSVLMFLFIVTAFAKRSEGQDVLDKKVTINIQNENFRTALRKISRKAGITFSYSRSTIPDGNKISVSANDEALSKLFNNLFDPYHIDYEVIGTQVVLMRKLRMAYDSDTRNRIIINEAIPIKGIVRDDNGNPLEGVSVQVKGTSIGTTTDANGNYAISVENEDEVLVFSSIGYITQEIPINGRTEIDVTLLISTSSLDDVIIVGYGTQKKSDLTGAITQVDASTLQNRPISNLGAGLQGVVPNLQVTSGNAPGQGSSFNIRGITSINGGSPLILVDGVVEDPNLINPNDVESITVLKDASSAAIYGARAAYGVILITTKSGKKDQHPSINVSSSYAVNDLTRRPKYMNSLDYINYMDTASINAGSGSYFSDRIRQGVEAYFKDPFNNLPVLYDPSIDIDGKYEYVGNTDWSDSLYKKGGLIQNNVSIMGGSQSTTYYLSYGNLRQNGHLTSYNDFYQRQTINANLKSDITDWLNVSGNVRYTYSFEDHPSGGAGGNSGISATSGQLKNDLRPLMPIRHPDGHWAGQGSFTNPFAVGAVGGHNQTKVNDLWMTGAIRLKPIKDMNLNADYTFNPYSNNNEFTSRLIQEYHADGTFNIYPWTNPNLVRLSNANDYYHALNVYGDYQKQFGSHLLKLLVGFNEEVKKTKSFNAQRTNLIDNNLIAISRATGPQTVGGAISSWSILGYFYRLNYSFKDRYFLEVNSRIDGSSKFPDTKRYVFSPSVSGAWKVSSEKFWRQNESLASVVNELKLRGSFGSLGNQDIGSDFPYVPAYGINTALPYILGSTSTLPVSVAPGGLVSPNFTWEKVKQWDIGVDISLLSNRLQFSYDYYNRFTNGMLTAGQPLPAVLGTGVPTENAANLKTGGWELSLAWMDKVNDAISYNFSVVLSNSVAHITKFNNPTELLSNYYPGYEIGQIWGLRTDGLFQDESEIDRWVDQSQLYSGKWNPGDVKYVDLDGDNKITNGDNTLSSHGDLRIIGNSQPRYLYGVSGGVRWKSFNVSIWGKIPRL